jgi:hypothetical protein
MTTLEPSRRTTSRLASALLTLALAAATVAGYRSALQSTGEAVQSTLAHTGPQTCGAHLAAALPGSRSTC